MNRFEDGVFHLDHPVKLPLEVLDEGSNNIFLEAMESQTIEISGSWVDYEEDTMVCEKHGVSLHIHECEGFDF